MDYARKCDIRVPEVKMSSLTIAPEKEERETPYFKPTVAAQIIAAAREPYKTIFALAWHTGLRAGELLALNVNDLDFERKLILPRKQVDDSTRQLRELKTKKSKSPIAMAPSLEAVLRNYTGRWKPNPSGLLFPTAMDGPARESTS